MNPFNVTLTHAQANLIFNALNSHVQNVQSQSNALIQYLDSEFKNANPPAAESPKTEEQPVAE